MKRQATEDITKNLEKRAKTSHSNSLDGTKDVTASSASSNPSSSQQSARNSSSQTAETDYQQEPNTERAMLAKEVLDLFKVAFEAEKKMATPEEDRLAILTASGRPTARSDLPLSAEADPSQNPLAYEREVEAIKRKLAVIAEEQQLRFKRLADILDFDNQLQGEALLKPLRSMWFRYIKKYSALAAKSAKTQVRFAQARSVLHEREKAWEAEVRHGFVDRASDGYAQSSELRKTHRAAREKVEGRVERWMDKHSKPGRSEQVSVDMPPSRHTSPGAPLPSLSMVSALSHALQRPKTRRRRIARYQEMQARWREEEDRRRATDGRALLFDEATYDAETRTFRRARSRSESRGQSGR